MCKYNSSSDFRCGGLQALFISDPLLVNEVMNATPVDGLERDDIYSQFQTVTPPPNVCQGHVWVTSVFPGMMWQ